MTTNQLKMGIKPTLKTLCISRAPLTMDNVQHNCILKTFNSKTQIPIT